MEKEHIGFEIRTLSNLLHRKINQMVSEEEESLTYNKLWVLSFMVLHGFRYLVERDILIEF